MNRNSPGFIELQRGKIAATGEDRVRWLHGMVTNDVKGLAPGTGCYCFVLDAQGHVQSDCNVFMEPERLLIDCEATLTTKLFGLLDRFIIMDQVELADISATMGTLAIEGHLPAGFDISEIIQYPVPNGSFLWATPRRLMQAKEALLAADALPMTPDAYEASRIAAGMPRYGMDIDATTIANETGIERAMHYNKGCYIGQEIVERVRSRGHVNRKLVQLHSDQKLPARAPIEVDGKEVGRTTSAASSIALGYVRREFTAPGTKVAVAGIPAEVIAF